MNLTDCHGIAAFDFSNLSGYTQLIEKSTYKLNNCRNLLLIDVPDVVDLFIDPPLGKSDHSFILFSDYFKKS